MAIYRPALVRQADGSKFQWSNCTMASAAMALDRHTMGAKTSTGAKMRSCQSDQSGGTDVLNAAQAWSKCYGQTLDVRLKITWSTFIAAIMSGRGAIVFGWYAYIPAVYRGQLSANFGHCIYVNEIRISDGALLVYDPLNKYAVWVPQTYIKAFAGHLPVGRPATNIGIGYIQCGLTRVTTAYPTPVVAVTPFSGGPRTWHVKSGVTINGYDPNKPGVVVKSMKFTKDSAASASGTATVTWPGVASPPIPRGGPFLRVTNGVFAGLLIVASLVTVDDTPAPIPQPPTQPTVTLRYGGVKITPDLFQTLVASNQRRSPFVRSDNISRVAPAGTNWRAYQKTTAGTSVGGSTVWYGDATGETWMHASVLKNIAG